MGKSLEYPLLIQKNPKILSKFPYSRTRRRPWQIKKAVVWTAFRSAPPRWFEHRTQWLTAARERFHQVAPSDGRSPYALLYRDLCHWSTSPVFTWLHLEWTQIQRFESNLSPGPEEIACTVKVNTVSGNPDSGASAIVEVSVLVSMMADLEA